MAYTLEQAGTATISRGKYGGQWGTAFSLFVKYRLRSGWKGDGQVTDLDLASDLQEDIAASVLGIVSPISFDVESMEPVERAVEQISGANYGAFLINMIGYHDLGA